MKLVRELRLLQAEGNIGIEAVHLRGAIMCLQGADAGSRAAWWRYGATGLSHDTFSPLDWPRFELNGEAAEEVGKWVSEVTVDASDPGKWTPSLDLGGRDSFVHARPAHAPRAFAMLLEAQLRHPTTTSFTVVVPQIGVRGWSKYLKHFRHKRECEVHVSGLGYVKHWVLRYEAGDGLRERNGGVEEEEEEDMSLWSLSRRSDE